MAYRKRHKMSKYHSRKVFRKGFRVKSKNMRSPMRGGWRI